MKQTKKEAPGYDVINTAREYKERNYKKLQWFGFESGLGLELWLGLEKGVFIPVRIVTFRKLKIFGLSLCCCPTCKTRHLLCCVGKQLAWQWFVEI